MTDLEHNEVVLMGTLENFPWKTISPRITDLVMDISANINYVPDPVFPIISMWDPSKVCSDIQLIIKGEALWFHFLSCEIFVCEFRRERPPFPIGTVTFHAHIEFKPNGTIIKVKGQVGDEQKKDPKTNEYIASNFANTQIFLKDIPEIAFQDPNVNALQTKIKWFRKPPKQ